MDNKKLLFYGTSLNQSSQDDSNEIGPIQRRRARLNNLQSARDDQGRQRFHGAFTGGFSAGYYNTVDSVEGFQPKSFVSKRGDNARRSKFSHKPEDYMDEEDFGEFGIAPKKIRLAGGYTSVKSALFNKEPSSRNVPALLDSLRPAASSIGEMILNRVCGRGNRVEIESQCINYYLLNQKHDYHGLGYMPLKSHSLVDKEKQSIPERPLMAVLEGGRKLKISGTAFGSGLDDGDDFCDEDFAFNYDDPSNYNFKQGPTTKQSISSTKHGKDDKILGVTNFILCRDTKDADLHDSHEDKYPLPRIDKEWQMPNKMIDLLKAISIDSGQDGGFKDPLLSKSSQLLSNKFTSSSSQSEASLLATTETLGQKSGLLLYNDLKAEKPAKQPIDLKNNAYASSVIEPTISRQEFEWRPCSLLCRHFNVPNPFPDNAFFGTKHVDFSCDNDKRSDDKNKADLDDNSLDDLRRTIFNAYETDAESRHGPSASEYVGECIDDDDDKPQVVMLDADSSESHSPPRERLEDDPDIVVLGQPKKQEPEVITLSSDSPSTSSSSGESDRRHVRSSRRRRSLVSTDRDNSDKFTRSADQDDDDDNDDAYGPPLPPSLKALHDTADAGYRATRAASSRSPSSNRHRHRHRRHKDRKSKRAGDKR